MRVSVYSEKGVKTKSTMELPEEIFGVKPNDAVLRQYVHVYRINQRQGTVSTKTRGEVSGGGKKPWAQKGTGRARHGSIRSPIWVGGGVTHGPRPHKFAADFPKKMRSLALRLALSEKASEGLVLVVEEFSPKIPKTKPARELLQKLGARRPLVVFPSPGDTARRAFRNLERVGLADASALNPYEVLKAREMILFRKSVEQIKERLGSGRRVKTTKLVKAVKAVKTVKAATAAKPVKTVKPARAKAAPSAKVVRKSRVSKKK